jgi:rubrerythrin
MAVDKPELMKKALEMAVDKHFHSMYAEERNEAMSDFLLAEKAEAEGYPEVAEILREVARDELKHAIWMGRVTEKRQLDRASLASQLEGSMAADDAVVEREREIAAMARLLGREEDAATFEQMADDEIDHVEKYKQALELLRQSRS